MRGYKIKITHVFELSMRAIRAAERKKNGNNHTYGFPNGSSSKKRAYRISIRSPYFNKKGFFRHTRIFSAGRSIWGNMYHFIEVAPSKNELKRRRVKIARKPK